ncbi:hypothetical protein AWM75_03155 [Aerococcus urinaehominis]|uniref:Uncharacterized protein n=1 Tax=Aerococcus urinaehominis TaxID=128944 RepID=A0A0X8FKN0_9LACT|nr:hypothetical protein [Aerococcus urinaehominis]AMB99059.1 hypothetical protein AWM75_03155 [Aerococcus urinaehominis]SDM59362.1 hypothetical protein SAMN04487985_1274 [Aerococcus urinaehominis]
MANQIKAVLSAGQAEEFNKLTLDQAKGDVDQALQSIQTFVDQFQSEFTPGHVNIFALEALPKRRDGVARTAILLVNLTGSTLQALAGKLQLEVDDFGVNFEPVDWQVDHDFLGDWQDHEAIMIVDDFPFQGLPTQPSYQAENLSLTVEDFFITEA